MMHSLGSGKPQFQRIESEFNAWRADQHLSQNDVAKRVGATQATVSRVIRGEISNPQLLHKLCTMAGVDVHKKDPSYSSSLTTALNEVWDGSEEQGQLIAVLLYSANRLTSSNAR
jgi:transcriptional regulator with XRE-family HTH domain